MESQHLNADRIEFLAEQDGEPEQELKARLVERFRTRLNIAEAYLVLVRIDSSPELTIALCLRTQDGVDNMDAVKAASHEFKELFGINERMDIFFLTPAQVQKASAIARPFYQSPPKSKR